VFDSLDGLSQHRQCSVVLALEYGSKHGIRHDASQCYIGRHREMRGAEFYGEPWHADTRMTEAE
jgi:hypothetical protein